MKTQRYGLYALMAASFIYLLSISWCRWGDLIVDTFRDQWVFYSLLQGKILYRDLFYPYGFLPPYFVALFYKIFGVHVTHSIYVGIFVTTISALFMYRIGHLFLNRAFAALLMLNFLFVFAFNVSSPSGIHNFILPYSIASTFFTMFTLGALYCFIKFIQNEKAVYFVWWMVLLYCAFLSRIYFSFMVWVICVSIGMSFVLFRKNVRVACLLFLPLAAAAVSYTVFLYAQNGFAGFNEAVLNLNRSKSYFEFHASGLEHFSANVIRMAASFSAHILALSFFYLLGSKIAAIKNKNSKRIIACISYVVVFVISIILARILNHSQFALIPLVLIIGIIVYVFRLLFQRDSDKKRNISLVTLFSIAFVLIMRILFKTRPHGHGFFLLCPALICYYVFCVELCPSVLFKNLFKKRNISHHCFIFLAIFFVVLSYPFVKRSHYFFRARSVQVEVPGRMNTYHLPSLRTKRFCEAIDYVMKNTSEDETIVVLPSGIGLNFLAQRDNPLPYGTFHPTIILFIGEEKIIQRLEDASVDYIVIVTRPTPEHGLSYFGIDYGREIVSWIRRNYVREKLIGPDPLAYKGFGVELFKKKQGYVQ